MNDEHGTMNDGQGAAAGGVHRSSLDRMTTQNLKLAAAREALNDIESGMSLGLGTGSTAEELTKLLGEALRDSRLRDVRCTCTSRRTEELARSLGIPLFALAELVPLDLAIDG